MRRLGIIVGCVAIQLLMSTPAQAWWGWLDELSGPGPWMFVDGRYRLVCKQDPSVTTEAERTSKTPPANVMRSLNSFDRNVRWLAAIGGVGCILPSQWSTTPQASVNFSTGTFLAVANNPRPAGAGHLAMQKYEVSASTFLDHWKVFELNAGGGVFTGLGKSDFTRGYWTVTGTMTPYAAAERDAGRSSWLRTITVNFGVVVVPKGFIDKDFGATNGFRSDHEILKTISVTFDLARY